MRFRTVEDSIQNDYKEDEDRFLTHEISLFRLEQCAKQAKLGVSFVAGSPSAITCQDIVITTPPNQVLPHKHLIKK